MLTQKLPLPLGALASMGTLEAHTVLWAPGGLGSLVAMLTEKRPVPLGALETHTAPGGLVAMLNQKLPVPLGTPGVLNRLPEPPGPPGATGDFVLPGTNGSHGEHKIP